MFRPLEADTVRGGVIGHGEAESARIVDEAVAELDMIGLGSLYIIISHVPVLLFRVDGGRDAER